MSTKERLDCFYEKLNENNMRFLIAKLVGWLYMGIGCMMALPMYQDRVITVINFSALCWGMLAPVGRMMAYLSVMENNVQKPVWAVIRYTGIGKGEFSGYLRNIVIRFELKAMAVALICVTIGILIGVRNEGVFDMGRAVIAYIKAIITINVLPCLAFEVGVWIGK